MNPVKPTSSDQLQHNLDDDIRSPSWQSVVSVTSLVSYRQTAYNCASFLTINLR